MVSMPNLACLFTGTLLPCWNGKLSWERNAARPKDSASGHKNTVDFEYDSAHRRFNPKQYDPRKWMSVAKKAV